MCTVLNTLEVCFVSVNKLPYIADGSRVIVSEGPRLSVKLPALGDEGT